MTATGPLADVLEEARRLIALAVERDVPVRLLGGAAIHLRAGDRINAELRREPKDIDVAVPAGSGGAVATLLSEGGYRPDEGFNMLEGARRMLFHDLANTRQIDVFVHEFTMCHRIPLDERLLLESVTIPLAELMLTKLQIVELNRKDEIDVFAMLQAHEIGSSDGPRINAGRIADLCARDWGLHRTVTLNLERLSARIAELALARSEADVIGERLDGMAQAIDRAPKSGRWRLRARVGERIRWYEEPDEIGAA